MKERDRRAGPVQGREDLDVGGPSGAAEPERDRMEIHHLRTFVAVARDGGITRAADRLHLSQPAVSGHVKAMEEALGVTLFDRTPRGMALTGDGRRLLVKAERILAEHRDMIEEAGRLTGRPTGVLHLGAGHTASADVLGRLVAVLADRCPDLEVSLRHDTSPTILKDLRAGRLDGGLYNEAGEPEADLATVEVARFDILLAAPPGLVPPGQPLDWTALEALPWICPPPTTCCGRAAEEVFRAHGIRPRRIVHIDRENVTRRLIAEGAGLGLLHGEAARAAQARSEADLLCTARGGVRLLFAHLASRAGDPRLAAVRASLESVAPV
jgi:DNA-binding transcriptional LysR family regulator